MSAVSAAFCRAPPARGALLVASAGEPLHPHRGMREDPEPPGPTAPTRWPSGLRPELDVVWPAGHDLSGAPVLWEARAVAAPASPLSACELVLFERLRLAAGLLGLGSFVVRPGMTARHHVGFGLLLCGLVFLLHSGGRFVLDQRAVGRLRSRATLAGVSTALLLAAAGAILTFQHGTTG